MKKSIGIQSRPTMARPFRLRTLTLTLALAFSPALAPQAWAVDDAVAQKLIAQARYWQQKNRPDLAADAWRKLLRADPEHPVALVQLGILEVQSGNAKEAEDLYKRAKALKESPPNLSELETAFKLQSVAPDELKTARKQAQTGQPEQAVKTFQSILGDTKPTGQFGLEYYQTLGGTREGFDEARRGMEQLVRTNPGDTTYLLALARHLTYRESTRREGIRQLARLAQQEATAQEAKKAWRQGLVWLGARANDKPLFQQYLSVFSNDQAVRERLRQLERPGTVVNQKPDLASLERQAGFRWLDSGDVEKAEIRFREILAKKPNDLDAKGGLASVFMRRSAWVEASALLDDVVAKGGKRWRAAQQTAHYWTLMGEINEARQADQNADVESKLKEALAIDPKEPAGLVILADIVAEKRDFVRAEPLYRQILQRQPNNPSAFLGLVSVLSQTGREQEALALIAAQNSSGELKMLGLNQTKAQALYKLAQKDEQSGAFEMAMQRMEDALLLDPASPFIRLALARLYQRVGDVASANALVDNLLDTYPDLPEALYARALLYAEQERPSEALMLFERIPALKRTTAMAADQRRLWVQVQVQRARQLTQQGQTQAGMNLLEQAQSAAGNDLNLLTIVAGGWADTGQAPRALQILRDVRARNGNQDVGGRIQYAGLLLNTKQDAELAAVLRDLAQQSSLTAKQYDDVNNIILAYTLRQTDALREAGRLADAFETVSPALTQSNDPRLVMALARVYQSGGDAAQALQLAESVIEREPDDLEHRLFAAGAALSAKQLDKASLQVNAALELAPDHPRVLAQAGRVEKQRGNLSRALEYFQFAQALEREKSAFGNAPSNLALRLVDATPSASGLPGLSGSAGLLGSPGLSNTPAARSQLLPVPGGLRTPGLSDTRTNQGGLVLPVPGANRSATNVRQFSDPLANSQYPNPATSQIISQTLNAINVGGNSSNLSALTKSAGTNPDASTLDAIYKAAYQAARDSFENKPEATSKRSKSTGNSSKSSKAKKSSSKSGAGSDAGFNSGFNSSKRSNTQNPSDILEQAISTLASAPPTTGLSVPEWRATNRLAVATPASENADFALSANSGAARFGSDFPPPLLTQNEASNERSISGSSRLSPQLPPQLPPQLLADPVRKPSRLSLNKTSRTNQAENTSNPPSTGLRNLPNRPSIAPDLRADTALDTPLNTPLDTTLPNLQGIALADAKGKNRERTVSEEIQDIELKFSTTLDVAAGYRNRSGEVGMNRLSEVEIPVIFKTSLDYDHSLTLRLTPVLLSAGELILADPNNATRFGSAALGPFLSNPFPNAIQEANGVALALGFGNENWKVDIGSSPLGFKVRNFVGGASYMQTVDQFTLKIGINRRAVTDSILSYSGTNDPFDGRIFGGVVKTGLTLEGTLGDEQFGVYGSVGGAELTGRRVQSNTEFEASAGSYLRVFDRLNQRVTVGLNLNVFGYRNNLSKFTLGHGGYFSPQQYVNLGFPIDLAGRLGKFSYQIGVDAGIRRIQQDRQVYFPNNPELQAALQTRITTTPALSRFAFAYNGETTSGFGVNFRTAVEYLIAPQFAFGGRLSFDNSRNFTQQSGLIYLRYSYNPLIEPVSFPPQGPRPLYLGESL